SQRQTFAAGLIDLIDSYFRHALPVLQRASIPLVTWTANKPAFNHDILTPERAIPVAARRAEDRNDRRADGRGKMHRTGIAAHKQSCRFAKRDEFFETCWNLAYAGGLRFKAPYQALLARPPGHGDRKSIIHET